MTGTKSNPDETQNQPSGVLTAEKIASHDKELIKRLIAYQKKSKLTWTEIAKRIGTNSSILSSFKSIKYTGDVGDVNEKVDRFLRSEVDQSKAITPYLKYVEIENNRIIKKALYATLNEKIMAAVVGSTGLSKTTSILDFAEKENCIRVVSDRSYRWPIEYVREIHSHPLVGGSGIGSMHFLVHDSIKKLRGRNVVIAVDQCDYLTHTIIDIIRLLNDPIKEGGAGVGVFMTGLPGFLEKIVKNENAEYRQIRDRFRVIKMLAPFTLSDCRKIIDANFSEANELAEIFFTQSDQSIRVLSTLIYNVKKDIHLTGAKLDDKTIYRAKQLIQREWEETLGKNYKRKGVL